MYKNFLKKIGMYKNFIEQYHLFIAGLNFLWDGLWGKIFLVELELQIGVSLEYEKHYVILDWSSFVWRVFKYRRRA